MSAGWVAGSVRARLLLDRRLGADGARAVAAAGTAGDAARLLAGTAFADVIEPDAGVEAVERAVARRLLVQLRVLAGWLPSGAVGLLRALAAWFELANVEDRLAYLLGAEGRTPFDLGALASAWPQARTAASPAELRAVLRGSVWGDPGADGVEAFHLGLRISWADRVARAAPEAAAWAAGALALLVAQELYAAGRPLDLRRRDVLHRLGRGPLEAPTLAEFAALLPPAAAWALVPAAEPGELWRAEAGWRRAVGGEAAVLVRRSREGRGVIVGAAALLALDAARTMSALAVSARPSPAAREAFDALA